MPHTRYGKWPTPCTLCTGRSGASWSDSRLRSYPGGARKQGGADVDTWTAFPIHRWPCLISLRPVRGLWRRRHARTGAPPQTQGLWLTTSDGRATRRLLLPPPSATGQPDYSIGPIAWSPDRLTLAYAVNNAQDYGVNPRGLGVWLMRYDRPHPRLAATLTQLGVIADGSQPITQLSWSPDGHILAFHATANTARPDHASSGSVRRCNREDPCVGQGRMVRGVFAGRQGARLRDGRGGDAGSNGLMGGRCTGASRPKAGFCVGHTLQSRMVTGWSDHRLYRGRRHC